MYVICMRYEEYYWTGRHWDDDYRQAKRFKTRRGAEKYAHDNLNSPWTVQST